MNKILDMIDSLWDNVGTLGKFTVDKELKPGKISISYLNKSVGIYKAILNNKVVYIGRAKEYKNGALRKRLMDYVRDSDSGRDTPSGKKMHENKDKIFIKVIVIGEGEECMETADYLEKLMIHKYNPEWNKLDNSN